MIQRDWSPFDYLSDNIVGAVAGAIPELAATGAPSLEGTSEAAKALMDRSGIGNIAAYREEMRRASALDPTRS